MVLRELLARFDLKFDDKGFKKADKSIDAVKNGLRSLGGLLVGGSIIFGFKRLIDLGSDAAETMNVLNEVFKENSQEVQQWAADFGEEVGRSEFAMRELAGTLGAVINPMMKGNAEVAAEMSTNLGQLTVDLGSFYNAAESNVLLALRSGITGEAEPMKRFGIVMLEATLQEFALAEGIKKRVKDMNVAEKTQLRYQFIMANTTAAQGDALRTADGYANAIKGVTGALKDIATRIMLTMMPAVGTMTSAIRDGLRTFDEMIEGTNLVQSALILLGSVAAVTGLKMLLPFAKLLPAFGVLAFKAFLLWVVLDDIITLFEGGDSAIGRFIDDIFGPGSAAAAVDALKEAGEGMVLFYRQEFIPTMEDAGASAFDFFQSLQSDLSDTSATYEQFGSDVHKWSQRIRDGWALDMERFNAFKDNVVLGIDTMISALEKLEGVTAGVAERIKNIYKLALEGIPLVGPAVEIYNRSREATEGNAPERQTERNLGRVPESQLVYPDVLRGPISNVRRGDTNVNQNNELNISMNVPAGSQPERIARETATQTKRVLADQQKDVVSALKQGA